MEKELTETEQLDAGMRNIIEEARVILPGVQALFGFQTIAVFSDRFAELAYYAKACHAVGLIMVIVSVAMVMTPAIYYRTCHGHATRSMVSLSSTMVRGALAPLAIGLALDMFTVIHVVTVGMPEHMMLSVAAALGTLALLTSLWFILPRQARALVRRERTVTRQPG